MSSKRFSPTSLVLRSSRFFSLPPPLPRPDSAFSGLAAANKVSDSATSPYPLQQAITSPPSSQARGDWGLKRPLPLRSTTKTSTPFFRIHSVDTREHITDFDSAADLTITLEKFQELGIPVTTLSHRGTSTQTDTRSVFEPELDHTDPNIPRYDPQTGELVQRWRSKGPWLAGMTEAEFLEYFEGQLVGRKDEFREFIRKQVAENAANSQRQKQAVAEGRGGTGASPNQSQSSTTETTGTPPEITDKTLHDITSRLRQNFHPASDLAHLLTQFLDLPGNTATRAHFSDQGRNLAQGPPSTHLSAGLSYLRTDALLNNHPIFGPMSNPTPQKGRLLSAESNRISRRDERIGVAGLVTDKPEQYNSESRYRYAAYETIPKNTDDQQVKKDMSLKSMGLTIAGGNKIWVEPKRASVDERGRVQLDIRTAKEANIAGRVGELGTTGIVGGATGAGSFLVDPRIHDRRPQGSMAQGRRDLDFATGTRVGPKGGGVYGMGGNAPSDAAIVQNIQEGLESLQKKGVAPEEAPTKRRRRKASGLEPEDF